MHLTVEHNYIHKYIARCCSNQRQSDVRATHSQLFPRACNKTQLETPRSQWITSHQRTPRSLTSRCLPIGCNVPGSVDGDNGAAGLSRASALRLCAAGGPPLHSHRHQRQYRDQQQQLPGRDAGYRPYYRPRHPQVRVALISSLCRILPGAQLYLLLPDHLREQLYSVTVSWRDSRSRCRVVMWW